MAVAATETELGLLAFTDDDLASTYASDPSVAGKKPKLLNWVNFLNLLVNIRKSGATHVFIDLAPGKRVR